MKKKIRLLATLLTLMAFVLVLTNSCKKVEDNKTLPLLTTDSVTNISEFTATCGGEITSDGISKITARGVCWSNISTPTITDSKTIDSFGTGNFKSQITGLYPNTNYYVRAYATNSTGTGYGSVKSVTTQKLVVTDIDGNVYNTITIGKKIWMVENLNVTHYRNGDPIPNVTSDSDWCKLTSGAYCNYNNNENNSSIYGKLYNWYTIIDSRNLAPSGWHVSTAQEWFNLILTLDSKAIIPEIGIGSYIVGGKLKETDTIHWLNPNTGATNEVGFTALPGGNRRSDNGAFFDIRTNGTWWNTSESYVGTARLMAMNYRATTIYFGALLKASGLSVRCVKDN